MLEALNKHPEFATLAFEENNNLNKKFLPIVTEVLEKLKLTDAIGNQDFLKNRVVVAYIDLVRNGQHLDEDAATKLHANFDKIFKTKIAALALSLKEAKQSVEPESLKDFYKMKKLPFAYGMPESQVHGIITNGLLKELDSPLEFSTLHSLTKDHYQTILLGDNAVKRALMMDTGGHAADLVSFHKETKRFLITETKGQYDSVYNKIDKALLQISETLIGLKNFTNQKDLPVDLELAIPWDLRAEGYRVENSILEKLENGNFVPVLIDGLKVRIRVLPSDLIQQGKKDFDAHGTKKSQPF
jgi:hypothetical protein